MTKISKKKLIKEVSKKIEEIFSGYNKDAASKIMKELNLSTKLLVKKFNKTVKKTAKKKQKTKAAVSKKKTTTVKKKR